MLNIIIPHVYLFFNGYKSEIDIRIKEDGMKKVS